MGSPFSKWLLAEGEVGDTGGGKQSWIIGISVASIADLWGEVCLCLAF